MGVFEKSRLSNYELRSRLVKGRLHLILIEPFLHLTHLPDSRSISTKSRLSNTLAILLPNLPVPRPLCSIRFRQDSITMPHIIQKTTLIYCLVRKLQSPIAIHHILLPHSIISPTIFPHESSHTIHHVILPTSTIG